MYQSYVRDKCCQRIKNIKMAKEILFICEFICFAISNGIPSDCLYYSIHCNYEFVLHFSFSFFLFLQIQLKVNAAA